MENYITEIDILQESKDCFLTYATEVLTDRAIPAAEDPCPDPSGDTVERGCADPRRRG